MYVLLPLIYLKGFPGSAVVKNPPVSAEDARNVGLIPGLGRSPGVGNGNPLQYCCLEDSMDSILAWKIPWTEESGELWSWGHKESDTITHTH